MPTEKTTELEAHEELPRLIEQARRCLSAERELAAIRAHMLRFSDQEDEGQSTAAVLAAVELEANCEHERAEQAERELAVLHAAIDDALAWETPELEEAGDYVANVRRAGAFLVEQEEARKAAERERDELRRELAAAHDRILALGYEVADLRQAKDQLSEALDGEHAENERLGKELAAEKESWRNTPPHELVLNCPNCGKQHLDIGEFATRAHRKHLCENTPEGPGTGCGHLWVPFPYATRGVERLRADVVQSEANTYYRAYTHEFRRAEQLAAELAAEKEAHERTRAELRDVLEAAEEASRELRGERAARMGTQRALLREVAAHVPTPPATAEERCPRCDGDGVTLDTCGECTSRCSACQGTGQKSPPTVDELAEEQCPWCGGDHAVLELTRHLRATATPHVSVPALPIDAEDERVVDELFAKRERTVRRMREEPPPGETVPEPFKLGRALYGSIPWNACEVPAGNWEDAEEWERQAWDDVARNLHEAGKQSAADELAAKDRRIAELEAKAAEMLASMRHVALQLRDYMTVEVEVSHALRHWPVIASCLRELDEHLRPGAGGEKSDG